VCERVCVKERERARARERQSEREKARDKDREREREREKEKGASYLASTAAGVAGALQPLPGRVYLCPCSSFLLLSSQELSDTTIYEP